MATEKEADKVADFVYKTYGNEDWFGGVAIDVTEDDNYTVIVHSKKDVAIPAAFPKSKSSVQINVVPVEFEAQKDSAAQE